MRATTHKTIRDLNRQRAQVIAVATTVMLGVALFIASAGAFRNLSSSYQYTYQRLRFADVVATGGDTEAVARAAQAAGAASVATRTQADPPLSIDGTKLLGRVVGVPAGARPEIDDLDVVDGAYLTPGDPTGVLVERHAADTFGLSVGDQFEIFTVRGWQRVTVRGIAVSAEYLWPARSRQEVLGDPHGFAVVFAPQSSVDAWSGQAANQVLVRLGPGVSGATVVERLRDAGATDVVAQADQPSHASLQEDLDGFSEMSVAFPLLFLTAAAVASYVLLARRVLAERPIIGALMASGARRGRLVRHYLGQGLLIGTGGAVVGVVAGTFATGVLTHAYTRALNIPDTLVGRHYTLGLVGVAFGAFVGITGAAAPAVTVARTVPAEALRNTSVSHPPGRWSRWLARQRWLAVSLRMALRDVFRSRRRTVATMLGTVLALVLVLASIGMITSMQSALDLQLNQIQRQDATVTVATAEANDVAGALRALPGVSAVESVQTGAVTASHGVDRYTTVLTGYSPRTTMHRFHAQDGSWIALPAQGVAAGSAITGQLHIDVGDTFTLTGPDGSAAQVRLAALLDEPMGTVIYASTDVARRLLPNPTVRTYQVRFDAGADRDRMRDDVTAMPGVVAYDDAEAVIASIDQYLALSWAFVGMMVVLGAILAFAVIYVTMAVNLVERTNELATLRAAGVGLRRVGGTLATENLLATMAGIPIGLGLGVLAAGQFLATFSSDLFQFDLVLSWWVLPAAALGVLVAAAVSQGPAVRAVRRLDIARVVRERASG